MSSLYTTTAAAAPSKMLTLREHIEAECARWAASRGHVSYDEKSVTSSASTSTSSADSVFSSQLHCRYKTRTLSRRSSTSSFATEFEPAPAQQTFVVPRDFNGAPITVYASLEAAVAQSTGALQNQNQNQNQNQGQGGGDGEQPRRLVTPGKLYENEEEDDEIVYE